MTDDQITRLATTCLRPIIASGRITSLHPSYQEALDNVMQALAEAYQRGQNEAKILTDATDESPH